MTKHDGENSREDGLATKTASEILRALQALDADTMDAYDHKIRYMRGYEAINRLMNKIIPKRKNETFVDHSLDISKIRMTMESLEDKERDLYNSLLSLRVLDKDSYELLVKEIKKEKYNNGIDFNEKLGSAYYSGDQAEISLVTSQSPFFSILVPNLIRQRMLPCAGLTVLASLYLWLRPDATLWIGLAAFLISIILGIDSLAIWLRYRSTAYGDDLLEVCEIARYVAERIRPSDGGGEHGEKVSLFPRELEERGRQKATDPGHIPEGVRI